MKEQLPTFLVDALRERRDDYRLMRGFYKTRKRYNASNSSLTNLVNAVRLHLCPRKTILFFPQAPGRSQLSYKLSVLLGYGITTDPDSAFDTAFRQEAGTYSIERIHDCIGVERGKIINANSTDVSKELVGEVFADVFDYEIQVDPTQYAGPMVEKSNKNYTHDGTVVEGPLSPEQMQDGSVYQKAIDNTETRGDGRSMVVDRRVVIYGSEVPVAYRKYRPLATRFSNKNTSAELVKPGNEFSKQELKDLVRFAKKMGVDYCEIDVLRDNSDGRIYPVDVNNTPAGPPNGLTKADQIAALDRLKPSFERLIETKRL